MLSFFKDWVMNIVTLAMVMVIIEMLVPSGRMKKYVSLATGSVLVIAIINPIVGALGKDLRLEDFQLISSNMLDRAEIAQNSKQLEEEQMSRIAEVYRRKVVGQLEELARRESGDEDARADIIINDDYSSEMFGEIKRVYIYIGDKAEEASKGIPRIRKIEIKRGEDTGEAGRIAEDVEPELKRRLEGRIQELFGVESENIVITREGRASDELH